MSAAFPQMPDQRKIATLRTGSRATGLPAARLSPLSGGGFPKPLRLAFRLKPCVLMCLATGPAPLFSVAAGRGLVEVWIIDTHPIGLAASIGQSRLRTKTPRSGERGVIASAGSIAAALAAAPLRKPRRPTGRFPDFDIFDSSFALKRGPAFMPIGSLLIGMRQRQNLNFPQARAADL